MFIIHAYIVHKYGTIIFNLVQECTSAMLKCKLMNKMHQRKYIYVSKFSLRYVKLTSLENQYQFRNILKRNIPCTEKLSDECP